MCWDELLKAINLEAAARWLWSITDHTRRVSTRDAGASWKSVAIAVPWRHSFVLPSIEPYLFDVIGASVLCPGVLAGYDAESDTLIVEFL